MLGGLDLNVQLRPLVHELQRFFQRGDSGVGIRRIEPAACVQILNVRIVHVPDVLVHTGSAFQIGIVHHHQHAVPGLLHVQFNEIRPHRNGIGKGVEGVLRCIGRKSPMCHNSGILEQCQTEIRLAGENAVHIRKVQPQSRHRKAACRQNCRAPAKRLGTPAQRDRFRKHHLRHLHTAFLQQSRQVCHADRRGKERETPQHDLNQQFQDPHCLRHDEIIAAGSTNHHQHDHRNQTQKHQQSGEIAAVPHQHGEKRLPETPPHQLYAGGSGTAVAALVLSEQHAGKDPANRKQTAQNDRCHINRQQEFLFRHIVGEKIRNAHCGKNTGSRRKLHQRNQHQQMQHQKRSAAPKEVQHRLQTGTHHSPQRGTDFLKAGLPETGTDCRNFKQGIQRRQQQQHCQQQNRPRGTEKL